MDPTLGGVLGVTLGAFIAGAWAWRQTRAVEAGKAAAEANTTAMESVKVQIDGWDRLADSYRTELDRKDRVITTLEAANDRLNQQHRLDRVEIEFCRANHPPIGGTDD